MSQAGRPPTPPLLEDFVTVNNKQLWWHNKPFHFLGFNNYFMMTRAADEYTRQHDVIDVFDAAARLNMTVMRMWAFADGAAEWNALQPRAGWYDQRILVWVVGVFYNGLVDDGMECSFMFLPYRICFFLLPYRFFCHTVSCMVWQSSCSSSNQCSTLTVTYLHQRSYIYINGHISASTVIYLHQRSY